MRQMKQPRKDALREQLALAATRIIELEAENAALRDGPVWKYVWGTPRPSWWRRLLGLR